MKNKNKPNKKIEIKQIDKEIIIKEIQPEKEEIIEEIEEKPTFNEENYFEDGFSNVSLNKRGFVVENLEDKLENAPKVESSKSEEINYLKKPDEEKISYKKVNSFETEDELLNPEQKQIAEQKRIYSAVEEFSPNMKAFHEREQKKDYVTIEDTKKKHSFFGMN